MYVFLEPCAAGRRPLGIGCVPCRCHRSYCGMLCECLAVRTTIAMYTPTRTPPRRDALQKAVEEADKGSAIRRRAAEAAATAGALRIRERKMTQDRREESHALGEYTRRGYEPPSARSPAETRALSFSSSSSDADDEEPDEAAAEPSQSWLQLICPWAPWRQ
jgi:hypothetical protein